MLKREIVLDALNLIETYFFGRIPTSATNPDSPLHEHYQQVINVYLLASRTNFVYINDVRIISEIIEQLEALKAIPLLLQLRMKMVFFSDWDVLVNHFVNSITVPLHETYTVNYEQMDHDVNSHDVQDDIRQGIHYNDIIVLLFLMSLLQEKEGALSIHIPPLVV